MTNVFIDTPIPMVEPPWGFFIQKSAADLHRQTTPGKENQSLIFLRIKKTNTPIITNMAEKVTRP